MAEGRELCQRSLRILGRSARRHAGGVWPAERVGSAPGGRLGEHLLNRGVHLSEKQTFCLFSDPWIIFQSLHIHQLRVYLIQVTARPHKSSRWIRGGKCHQLLTAGLSGRSRPCAVPVCPVSEPACRSPVRRCPPSHKPGSIQLFAGKAPGEVSGGCQGISAFPSPSGPALP